ncbi:MAG: DUF1961 family protein [Butyrivibrio sp.]|nr:DUF1961 family protein [Butyrivibrio sp.]
MATIIYENTEEFELRGVGSGSGGRFIPKVLPSDVMIEWEFRPLSDDGRAVLSFAERDGREFCLEFFNRSSEESRFFHAVRLIKEPGGQVVSAGADPIPSVTEGGLKIQSTETDLWYKMALLKKEWDVTFSVNGLVTLFYHDDGTEYGDVLTGGNAGFMQYGDITALYRNVRVTWV